MHSTCYRRVAAGIFGLLVLLSLAALNTASPVFAASASSKGVLQDQSGGGVNDIQIATTANTHGYYTLINDPKINGQKDAVLLASPVLDLSSILNVFSFDSARVGVEYLSKYQRWAIVNEDKSPIPIGSRFNVQGYVNQTTISYTLFVNTGTFVNATQVGLGETDPNERIVVTPLIYEPAPKYDTHTLGVSYDKSIKQWIVFHEDGTAIQSGQFYNLLIWSSGTVSDYDPVVSANTYGLLACASVSIPTSVNDVPVATVDGTGITDPIAMLFDPVNKEWCVFDTHITFLPPQVHFIVSGP